MKQIFLLLKRIFNYQTKDNGDIPFYKIGTFGKEPDAFISRELYNEFRNKNLDILGISDMNACNEKLCELSKKIDDLTENKKNQDVLINNLQQNLHLQFFHYDRLQVVNYLHHYNLLD